MLDWDDALREAACPFVPDFEVIIDDLAEVSEQELLGRSVPAVTKLVLWLLRAVLIGFDPALIDAWAEVLNRAERDGPRAAIEHILQYLMSTEKGAALLGTVEQANISSGVREVVMTLAEQWKAEGIAQGKAEGKAESLLMFLRGRFSELPEEAEQRVWTASVADLDRWLLRVVTAESVDDVWG